MFSLFRGLAAAIVIVIVITASSWPAMAAPPPLEAYGRLPTVEQMAISPDGSKLAALVSVEDGLKIIVRETASGKLVFTSPLGNVKVRGIEWAGSDHILIMYSRAEKAVGLKGPKREYAFALDLDLIKRNATPLIGKSEGRIYTIRRIPTTVFENGAPVVIVEGSYMFLGQGVAAVYRIDLRNHIAICIEAGVDKTLEYAIAPNGEVLARVDYLQNNGMWSLYVRPHGHAEWKIAHVERAPIDRPHVEGLSADGLSVLINADGGNGIQLYAANLQTGSWSGPIPYLSGRTIIRDPITQVVIGASKVGLEHTTYEFLSPDDQKRWDKVVKTFPNEELTLVSWSNDHRDIIVKVEGALHGDAFFGVDLAKGTASWLVDEYMDLGSEVMAPRKAIHYKAADGLDIPAYLTLPRDRPGHGLPLIVLVHGGPADRDHPNFDWWSQALASRGYAVLQPEFRGSIGFSAALFNAGLGEWGRKMQTDLSDGVRALAQQGVIDPTRVCIMGASYGGTAAANAAAFDPKPYRCAVDVEGVVDMKRFLDYEEYKDNGSNQEAQRWWLRFMGAASRHDPLLDELSPARHADKISLPILLIHGQDDTVVPYSQSQEFADALKRAGKPFEFVTLKGEDHWLSHGETRLQMLTAAVAFIEKHSPPDPATAKPDAKPAAP